jgi:Ulp1 family protease
MHFKCLYALDSLANEGGRAIELATILEYLKQILEKRKGVVLDKSEWTFYPASKENAPQQTDSNNCGVFTCMFVNVLAEYFKNQETNKVFRRVDKQIFSVVNQTHMATFRKQMQLDIMRGEVFGVTSARAKKPPLQYALPKTTPDSPAVEPL